ncbi:MAG: tRNA 2-thiouridine(34) synthase MnmA [Clostridia bacterium]|nr:tRNA 2-thiouridine(34) synthase MnmA [Clostridia bacterium]
MAKVMIGMSGGVDSSAAALVLQRQGYDLCGVTLLLTPDASEDSREVADAKAVCASLGIEHICCDLREQFSRDVMRHFCGQYSIGKTPNPCIECNRYIKFGLLLEEAKKRGYDKIVTGHYARIEEENGRFLLKKGADRTKDQTYVLYSLAQEQLKHTILPLGEMSKAQVREIAEANGFINAHKRDSQDICFVPDGDYAGFIERYSGKTYPNGEFVDLEGNVLGEHKGIIRYTRGQRKGLGLALPQPMYVCRTDLLENKVILGLNDDLFSSELDANDINLIACDRIDTSIRVEAKVRYSQGAQSATVWQTDDDRLHIEFDEPQRAITKGQAVVMYDGDTVVGGGKII